jgi:hypothetical protein
LVGVRSVEQLQASLGGLEVHLEPDGVCKGSTTSGPVQEKRHRPTPGESHSEARVPRAKPLRPWCTHR